MANSVLSLDVVRKLNTERGFDENVTPSLLYSERDSYTISNRSLLADALETTAQNDVERAKLSEYKSKIEEMDKQSQKLSDLR